MHNVASEHRFWRVISTTSTYRICVVLQRFKRVSGSVSICDVAYSLSTFPQGRPTARKSVGVSDTEGEQKLATTTHRKVVELQVPSQSNGRSNPRQPIERNYHMSTVRSNEECLTLRLRSRRAWTAPPSSWQDDRRGTRRMFRRGSDGLRQRDHRCTGPSGRTVFSGRPAGRGHEIQRRTFPFGTVGPFGGSSWEARRCDWEWMLGVSRLVLLIASLLV